MRNNLYRRRSKIGATAALLALMGSVFAVNAALADNGGAGGIGGGAWGGHGALDVYYGFFDNIGEAGSPGQGWGAASIESFINQSPLRVNPNGNNTNDVRQACTHALMEATQRGIAAGRPNSKSRVVGIMWAVNDGVQGGDAGRSAGWYYDKIEEWKANGYPGIRARSREKTDFIAQLAYSGVQKVPGAAAPGPNSKTGSVVDAVCVAVNDGEPPIEWNLTVKTDHASVVTEAGSTAPVSDVIHASNDGGQNGRVNAQVVLNYDGPEGSKAVTKDTSISVNGDTRSPEFTPADFGWSSWPATGDGKTFWFDVKVAKQGDMAKAVDTADRDLRESWPVKRKIPSKVITNGETGAELANTDVLASGMFYNARITAHSNGYESSMTITDTVDTEDVVIGGKEADDTGAVQVLDPKGQPVQADVTVSRSGGKTAVSATVTNITDQGDYTLVVPTYAKPTGADYTIPDDSKVCYTAAKDHCLTGNSKVTRKVTPTPDKVWTLDENGSLKAADPQHTNQVAADQKVFLPNDGVSAVVNDHIAANLEYNLEQYSITDDWSDGLKYITMPGAKVYFQGQDVTSMFDITVDPDKGTTTAVAKPEFLAKTGKLTAPGEVKLIITGSFRTDYETHSMTEKLVNKGSVTWNNETKQTNVPPVFTWTPDPHKQVVGSGEQDGDKTYEEINGLSVVPGQKVEYTVQLDLNVPDNQARGIKSLGVKDVFDPMLKADPKSIEVYDPRTNKPIAAKNYDLKLDEDNHTFTLMFTEDFIKKNTEVDSFGAVNWKDNATFILRFSGTVRGETPDGSTIENRAWQIVNGVEFKTEVPKVHTPPIEPHKEDLSTNNVDINGKTVVQGDILRYRLTLDAVPKTKLAYYVHKLGMVDDYDEDYLDISPEAISVVGKTSGKDVTDRFNIQVKDGKFYVFAKQVDWTNNWGQLVKGDPQPDDLAVYDAAPIVQGETPIIDQDLLNEDYYIVADAKVIKETDDYTIVNQARENFENVPRQTEIVSNPLKDIDPKKDVVVDESTKDTSIDTQEVKLNSTFNYRLRSSEIPANRAYGVRDWSVSDTFDITHDAFTGIWAVYADTDVYDGDKLVFKKGDLLTDSVGHESEIYGPLFEATWDGEKGTFNVVANDTFERIVNSRGDLPQAWSVYTKMERIAPGEKIVNTVDETYNGVNRKSNEVWTHTPEHPSIDVEKFTLSEGWEQGAKGDRDTVEQALPLVSLTDQAKAAREAAATDGKDGAKNTEDTQSAAATQSGNSAQLDDTAQSGSDAASGGDTEKAPSKHEEVQVGFTVTNTGDVDLKDVALTDLTHEGTTGSVTGVMCEVSVENASADPANAALTNGVSAETKTIKVSADKIGVLKAGQSVSCVGTLTGVEVGTVHSDTATATGKSVFTGTEVKDTDDWHAKLASTPSVDVEKYSVAEGWEQGAKGDHDTSKDVLKLNADGTIPDDTLKAVDPKVAEALPKAVAELKPKDGTVVGFTVTNTGDAGLKAVSLNDTTWEYTTGSVSEFKLVDAEGNLVDAKVDKDGNIEIGDLAPGQSVQVVGVLRGVKAGTPHADTATVTGTSIDDQKVSDKDDFHASVPTPENPEPKSPTPPPTSAEGGKGAVTGEAVGANAGWLVALGGLMAAAGLGGGATWWNRRRKAEPSASVTE